MNTTIDQSLFCLTVTCESKTSIVRYKRGWNSIREINAVRGPFLRRPSSRCSRMQGHSRGLKSITRFRVTRLDLYNYEALCFQRPPFLIFKKFVWPVPSNIDNSVNKVFAINRTPFRLQIPTRQSLNLHP